MSPAITDVPGLLVGHAHTAASSTFAGRPLLVAPGVVWTLRLPWEGDEFADREQPPGLAFHILGNDATRADNCAIPYGNGSNKAGVGANKSMFADTGGMFFKTIVIAGDRSRADIAMRANIGIANIAQVVHLNAFFQCRLFNLYKITDMHFFANNRTGAQTGVRADDGSTAYGCPF